MRALLILSLIALSTSIDTRSCISKSCTAEYSPICATDEKGEKHFFGNSCAFKTATCLRKESGSPPLKRNIFGCPSGKRL